MSLLVSKKMADEFLEHFKQKCKLASGQQQTSIDDNLLEKQLNDPDLQRLLDAEHDQVDVEVFRFLAYRRANTGNISNFINFGKLSDKDVTSAALKNKLRSMRLSQRIQNKKNEIQKRNHLIEKDIELLEKLMAQKNTELDEDFKKNQQRVSLEICKIKRNIHSFSEKEKNMKSTMDQDIKKLKVDETRAKADMERKIEEMKKEFMKAEEATNKNILQMNEDEENMKKYYHMKIQKLKDNEAEIHKNIKNKQNMLARKEENFKKSIKNLQLYEVEKTSELEAKLKEMNKNKDQEEEKIKKNIQEMQNTLKILEEEFNKSIEDLRQQEAEMKKEIELRRQKINEMIARNRIETEQVMQTGAKKKIKIEEYEQRFERVFGTPEFRDNTSKKTVWDRDIKKENIEESIEPQQKRLALNERDAPVNFISVRNTRLRNHMTEEALTTNRSKSRVVHPGGQFATISERHRWTQRTHRAPY